MSTQLKLRRGTTAQHSTFTGASGEITIDTDKKTVVVHDGTTAGGRALPQFDSSGNLPIPTGTANGVAYLNGSKALTSGSALTFDGTDLNVTGGITATGTVTLPSTTSIGDVSATELQYLNSVTSNVQDQINAKAPIDNPTFTGTVSLSTGTANGVLYLNGSKQVTSGSGLVFDGTNLGIGTSSPSYKLDVRNSNEPLLNLYNTAATSNDTSEVQISSYGVYWNIISSNASSFRWKTYNTERMRLDPDGNLLVGTTSTFDNVSYLLLQTLGGIATKIQGTTLTTQVSFFNDNGRVGWVGTSGSSTSYNTSSDYRLKEDYRPVADAIDRLNQLKPINFAWKVDGSRCDGFLAHELQEVIPEAATGHKDETRTEEYEVTPKVEATFDEEGNELTPAVEAVIGEREVPVYQGIDQSKIVPLLTAALQEAVAKIESLTHRIEALEYTKQGE